MREELQKQYLLEHPLVPQQQGRRDDTDHQDREQAKDEKLSHKTKIDEGRKKMTIRMEQTLGWQLLPCWLSKLYLHRGKLRKKLSVWYYYSQKRRIE